MNSSSPTITWTAKPELKDALVEASHALAQLDADRLEEMASYCTTLVGDQTAAHCTPASLDLACREAWKEMAIFMRVLEATRANLNVMRRLREIHTARLEYSMGAVGVLSGGGDHGDH